LGRYGLETVSRVMGLLLVAVAVEFMLAGIKASL
jgi:small neutral amino acid transporter SnatA (MarC family)